MDARASPSTESPDLGALKARQRGVWSSGDYALIGSTLQITRETLLEAVDPRAGWRVLDVAAGNGNATLAAARRGCIVTSTDYVPELLEHGKARAAANRLDVAFRQADVEALPFDDASFDAVLSTFGVMFTPNQEKAASEMLRVCRPGGRIGLANWTPQGFIGQVFKAIGRHVPPPAGVKLPGLWGTRDRLDELFGAFATVAATPRNFVFRYRSPAHFIDVFRNYYGPVLKAFASLDTAGQSALATDLAAVVAHGNRSGDETMVVPGEYLEVVVTKR
jgi:SAM-dependent methyltransferase